jgi:4'-phosphopantetheinyl transferase EntD
MIETILPAGVVAVEAFEDRPGQLPFPGEEEMIANAVDGRRREFITARRCAREALRAFGYPDAPIPRGPRREPRWPAGMTGSITHCAGYRAAAAARTADVDLLGIDAEPDEPLPADVAALVTVPGEPEMLARLTATYPGTQWGRLLFSAKESVYKAWFPVTGRWLGFDEARVDIDPAAERFVATLLVDGGRTDGRPPLRSLHGRFLVERGLVVTAVTTS